MSRYTLTIETDDANEIARAIVNSGTKVTIQETKIEAKPETKVESRPEVKEEAAAPAKRGRPPKVAEQVAESQTETSGLTLADVQAKLIEVARKYGKPESVTILNRLGVAKSDQLKPEQYEEAIAQANAKLEEEI